MQQHQSITMKNAFNLYFIMFLKKQSLKLISVNLNQIQAYMNPGFNCIHSGNKDHLRRCPVILCPSETIRQDEY